MSVAYVPRTAICGATPRARTTCFRSVARLITVQYSTALHSTALGVCLETAPFLRLTWGRHKVRYFRHHLRNRADQRLVDIPHRLTA